MPARRPTARGSAPGRGKKLQGPKKVNLVSDGDTRQRPKTPRGRPARVRSGSVL